MKYIKKYEVLNRNVIGGEYFIEHSKNKYMFVYNIQKLKNTYFAKYVNISNEWYGGISIESFNRSFYRIRMKREKLITPIKFYNSNREFCFKLNDKLKESIINHPNNEGFLKLFEALNTIDEINLLNNTEKYNL